MGDGMSKQRVSTGALHLLTAREVCSARDDDHADGGGLFLRVRGKSSAWVLRYTAPSGRRREMGLGPAFRASAAQAGESLKAARSAAQRARDLLQRGLDPIDERDRRRQQAQEAEAMRKAEQAAEHWTLARCSRDYHERVIEPSRSSKHGAQWLASLENHVPSELWHRPVGDITAPELLQALTSIRPHERARRHQSNSIPETVQRIRQRLDAIFEDANFHGRCTGNPAAAIRRKLRESGAVQKSRGSFAALPYRDAPALMHRLRAMPGTAARALELAVLTASRTGEALEAAWSEIDLDAAEWRIPGQRMKKGEAHVVYLCPRAIEILKAQQGQDGSLVFPSPQPGREGKPMGNMALLAVLDRLGVRDNTTVHGLCRATFSTWANETGTARPDVIEACLAHEESNRVRAAYNRAQFAQERRALLQAWADYLAGAQVIAMPSRHRAA